MARRLLPTTLGQLPVIDGVLALALCVLAVGGLLTGQVQEQPWAVTVPIAVVSTLAIALRTRYPITVAVLVSTLAVAQALFAGGISSTLWALVVFLIVAYTVAAECDEGRALLGLGLVLGAQFLGEWLGHGSDYAFDTLVFGGVWLFGRGTRGWRTRATYAEQHRDELARVAVADERARIARELHDVVAHSLSVIAVQADAAEAALAKEPALAAAPMRAIRGSAREALVDMRQLLHVLRAEAPADAGNLTPARGIADLTQLVGTMREAGLPIEADIRAGESLSSGVQLAVYRIAQEGLTNVRKHAGAVPTRLLVVRDGDTLRIEVRNAPSPRAGATGMPSTGHGLIGLRERVHAAGGTLDAGATPEGGFELVARLPLDPSERIR
ncbi:histidine kinase [Micropruina sp.]|uniref:sensor histidine kinase n=1 Tax=Micropruina sp. TaxID=2737536 RepID=UPI0026262FFD|nr:histidine kinase [Micropruina sp.]